MLQIDFKSLLTCYDFNIKDMYRETKAESNYLWKYIVV